MKQFILYSRSYCHLCDDLLSALEVLQAECRFSVEVIDVDADEALIALYDELVPVLMGREIDGKLLQLCHYHFDEAAVRAFLFGNR